MKTFKQLLMLAVVLAASGSMAYAAPCAVLTSATFSDSDVVTTSDTCVVAGYTFDLFALTAVAGFPTDTSFTMNITATTEGLFIGYTGLLPGQDVALTYRVNPGLSQMILATSSASVITETICSVVYDPFTSVCALAGGTVLGSPNPAQVTAGNFASITVAPSNTGYNFVYKDIQGGSDAIQNVVPEPMTFSMLGIGLLGIGLAARRRLGKK